MRSTNPLLVDLRTELLAQTGHSQTLLAKVRRMGIDHLSFLLCEYNYGEGPSIR
jgi:hypothetical protein